MPVCGAVSLLLITSANYSSTRTKETENHRTHLKTLCNFYCGTYHIYAPSRTVDIHDNDDFKSDYDDQQCKKLDKIRSII
jgi:hypothetical protein